MTADRIVVWRLRERVSWLLVACAIVGATASSGAAETEPRFSALVFSKTAGFRHDSIPQGIAAIKALGADKGFAVDSTEDAARFTDAALAGCKVVVFLSTTGDILDDGQKAAFERYIRSGGGFVGVHSASDTEYKWAWYGKLVGAFFHDHPPLQQGTIHVIDHHHLSTADLPDQWVRTDEWYNFASDPSNAVHVLMTV